MNRLFAALLMILPWITLCASAQVAPELSLGSAVVEQGTTASVELRLSGGTEPYAGVNARLIVPNGVEIVQVEGGDLIPPDSFVVAWQPYIGEEGAGATLIAYSASTAVEQSDGVLVVLTLEVDSDAELGTHALSFSQGIDDPLVNSNHALSNVDGTVSADHYTTDGLLTIIAPGSPTGSVTGHVTADGASVGGAQVTVVETAQSATTDSSGDYFIGGVPIGIYTLRIQMEGFITSFVSAVQVTTGAPVVVPAVDLVPCQQPSWTPVMYSSSTTLYATVTVDGDPAEFGDRVAAFVADECRAVGLVSVDQGTAFVTLIIQGDTPEAVTFRCFESSACAVREVYGTSLTTVPGTALGSPTEPFIEIAASTGPTAPESLTVSQSTLCDGTAIPITLSAIGGGGEELQWFAGDCAGLAVGSGNPLTIAAPIETTEYIAAWTAAGHEPACAVDGVTVVVLPIPVALATNDGPICDGMSVQLSGQPDGMDSYQWNGPQGFVSSEQNPLITPTASGSYTLTVTSAGCVSLPSSTDVVVDPLPMSPSVSATPALICAGSASTITLAATGGAGSEVEWFRASCGGTPIGTGNPLTIAAPTSTTEYFGRWTTASCGSSECGTATVVVEPLLVATASHEEPVCSGGPVQLIGGPDGMDLYSWTGPDGFMSSEQNPLVAVAASGTYTLSAEFGDCALVSASTEVDPAVAPATPVDVTVSPRSVCSGQSVTLTATAIDAEIDWFVEGCDGTWLGSGSPLVVSPVATATYYARSRNPITGCTSSACGSATVQVLPPLACESEYRFTIPDQSGAFDPATGIGTADISIYLLETDLGGPTYPSPIQGLSMRIQYDAEVVSGTGASIGEGLESVSGGAGPDFFSPTLCDAPATGDQGVFTLGVVVDFMSAEFLFATTEQEVVIVEFATEPSVFVGAEGPVQTPLSWIDGDNCEGTEVVTNVVVVDGNSYAAAVFDGQLEFAVSDQQFDRGDCNGDGLTDISDGVEMLGDLFIPGSFSADCADACDANDDGIFDVADPVYWLSALFTGGTSPPPPHPGCGNDPTADALDCQSYTACP